MSQAGIVIRREDKAARGQAARVGLAVQVAGGWALPWEKTLFISPGTYVPWRLLPVGFDFLEKWDMAAPFWREGVLAHDLGMASERKRTEAVLHDLRVPVYSHELLFVRASEAGQSFMEVWRSECAGGDERLAFLRALYAVKPAFCVLPRAWLAEVAERSRQDRMRGGKLPSQRGPLVLVELEPGRFVKCHKGDEEKVLAQLSQQRGRRG